MHDENTSPTIPLRLSVGFAFLGSYMIGVGKLCALLTCTGVFIPKGRIGIVHIALLYCRNACHVSSALETYISWDICNGFQWHFCLEELLLQRGGNSRWFAKARAVDIHCPSLFGWAHLCCLRKITLKTIHTKLRTSQLIFLRVMNVELSGTEPIDAFGTKNFRKFSSFAKHWS